MSNRKIGFTNGCFDIIHYGHLKLFEFCKHRCDYLIVGIDSNEMIKKAKGDYKPIYNQEIRKYVLENIRMVDEVFIFNGWMFSSSPSIRVFPCNL